MVAADACGPVELHRKRIQLLSESTTGKPTEKTSDDYTINILKVCGKVIKITHTNYTYKSSMYQCAKVYHELPLAGSRVVQRECTKTVRGDDALQHHDLLLHQGAQQGAAALTDQIHHRPHGRGACGEGSGDTGVT